MLRVLLLFSILLSSALAVHEKVRGGTDLNGLQSTVPTPDVQGGMDPNGLQSADPTSDLWGGMDPDGGK
jgi:hypothetical protein